MSWTSLVLVAALPMVAWGGQTETKKPASPREQYDALVEQYKQLGGAAQLADKFLELAQQNAKQPVALDALAWILTNVQNGATPAQAKQLLLADHLQSEALGKVCLKLVRATSLQSEPILRTVLDKSPHVDVQAAACFALAAHLQSQLKIQDAVVTQPSLRRRLEQFYGREFTRHAGSLDKQKVAAEVEQLYDRVVKKYGDVEPQMTEDANWQLDELRYLAVGKPAREIEGEDVDGVPFKLSDYRGKVVVLTFWGHW